MTTRLPLPQLLADDALLDRLGSRAETGSEPVAVLLGALAAWSDGPAGPRRPVVLPPRRLRPRRVLAVVGLVTVGLSGVGVAAARTVTDPGLRLWTPPARHQVVDGPAAPAGPSRAGSAPNGSSAGSVSTRPVVAAYPRPTVPTAAHPVVGVDSATTGRPAARAPASARTAAAAAVTPAAIASEPQDRAGYGTARPARRPAAGSGSEGDSRATNAPVGAGAEPGSQLLFPVRLPDPAWRRSSACPAGPPAAVWAGSRSHVRRAGSSCTPGPAPAARADGDRGTADRVVAERPCRERSCSAAGPGSQGDSHEREQAQEGGTHPARTGAGRLRRSPDH